MGLELAGITIKSPEDVRDLLMVESNKESFAMHIIAMANRWGWDSAMHMLHSALYNPQGKTPEPLLKPTHRVAPYNGGWVELEPIPEGEKNAVRP